jgi:hypothetical protein
MRRRMKNEAVKLFIALSLVVGATTSKADSLDDMIAPISHPTTFEDPRQITNIQPLYVHHKIQNDFVTGGGDVNVYALQARFKLTDDFSFIATKDGFVDLNPKAAVPDGDGLANVSLGGKYTVYKTEDSILSTGLRYEFPLGDNDALQGEGNGLFNPFFSYGYTACGFNFMAGSGLRIRSTSRDSNIWDTDLHLDYKLGDFYPTVELGMIKPFNSGSRLPIADEGQDFFNLGAANSAGRTILTASVGARYRVAKSVDLGVAYQFPLDRGTGSNILDWRINADMIIRFDWDGLVNS